MAFQWDLGQPGLLKEKIRFLFMYDFLCFLCLSLAIAGQLQVAIVLVTLGTSLALLTLIRQLFIHGFSPPLKPVEPPHVKI